MKKRMILGWAAAVGSLALSRPAMAAAEVDIFQIMQRQINEVSKAVSQNVAHIRVVMRQNQREIETAGSGVLVDDDGYVLTNQHVVENAESVRVFLPQEKKPYAAAIVGEDTQTDVALLKIDLRGKKITPPQFGDADALQVGQAVLAVGNPYGLERTVSQGIVSAVGRNLPIGFLINHFIQTDAMIDFGSSGGPLVDMKGRIVGLNSRSQGRGFGFTVPINTVLKVMEEYKKRGTLERAWLGIIVQPFNRDMAEYFGMPKQGGAIINAVIAGSPAEKAGLLAEDILVQFDGRAVEAEDEKEIQEMIRAIANSPVGKTVSLQVIRRQQKKTLTAQLEKQPKIDAEERESPLGFNVKEITTQIFIQNLLDTKEGVFVSYVEPGSVADRGNLVAGDVIQKIEGQAVQGLAEFEKMMKGAASKEKALLIVRRGRNTQFVLLKKDAALKSGKI